MNLNNFSNENDVKNIDIDSIFTRRLTNSEVIRIAVLNELAKLEKLQQKMNTSVESYFDEKSGIYFHTKNLIKYNEKSISISRNKNPKDLTECIEVGIESNSNEQKGKISRVLIIKNGVLNNEYGPAYVNYKLFTEDYFIDNHHYENYQEFEAASKDYQRYKSILKLGLLDALRQVNDLKKGI